MNARKVFDLEKFLDEDIDLDHNKVISFPELKHLLQTLYGQTVVSREDVGEVFMALKNVTVKYDLSHAVRIHS